MRLRDNPKFVISVIKNMIYLCKIGNSDKLNDIAQDIVLLEDINIPKFDIRAIISDELKNN